MRTNSGLTQPAETGEIAALLARGWNVVVPDYEGPDSQFLSGRLAGQAALDSTRAAERFAPAGLDGPRTRVAMMGYSGGSLPTIWANALARGYAPELDLVGVAAGGILADPRPQATTLDGSPFAGGLVLGFVGLDRAHPEIDVDSLLTPRGRALAGRDGRDTDGCGGALFNAPLRHLSEFFRYPDGEALLAVPRVKRVFDRLNLLDGPVPRAPAYFFHEINDEVAPIEPVDELVAADCARHATIDYQRAEAGEHAVGVAAYVPASIAFIQDRFAGRPAPNTCFGSDNPSESTHSGLHVDAPVRRTR